MRRHPLRLLVPAQPAVPSAADVAYLASTRSLYVGIVLLLRAAVSRSTQASGSTGSCAARLPALGASVLVEVVVNSTHGTTGSVLHEHGLSDRRRPLARAPRFVFSVTAGDPAVPGR
jgi:hypothetical protein